MLFRVQQFTNVTSFVPLNNTYDDSFFVCKNFKVLTDETRDKVSMIHDLLAHNLTFIDEWAELQSRAS